MFNVMLAFAAAFMAGFAIMFIITVSAILSVKVIKKIYKGLF